MAKLLVEKPVHKTGSLGRWQGHYLVRDMFNGDTCGHKLSGFRPDSRFNSLPLMALSIGRQSRSGKRSVKSALRWERGGLPGGQTASNPSRLGGFLVCVRLDGLRLKKVEENIEKRKHPRRFHFQSRIFLPGKTRYFRTRKLRNVPAQEAAIFAQTAARPMEIRALVRETPTMATPVTAV